jgi:hypothetical protein
MPSAYNIQPEDILQRLEIDPLTKITVPPPGPYTNGPDWDVVAVKIAAAEAEIHVAASAYYATPIVARDGATATEVSELQVFIVGKVLDLAMYKLLQLRAHLLNSGDRMNYYASVKKAIDAWLTIIAGDSKSRQTIGVAKPRVGGAITSNAEAWAESEEPRVNRCNLGAFT